METPTLETTLPRAIGYVRVSTDTQETARQIEAIKRHAAANGWALLEILAEEPGMSGRSAAAKAGPDKALAYYGRLINHEWSALERPKFAAALRRVAAGEVDVVMVYALDRLSRDTCELLLLEMLLRQAGTRLVAMSGGGAVDTGTASGRFTYRMMAAAAELECDQVSERTSATLQLKSRNGQHVGRPPFGWRMGDTGWKHHAAEWLVVESVAEQRQNGESYAAIAKKLNIPETRARRAYKAFTWNPQTAASAAA